LKASEGSLAFCGFESLALPLPLLDSFGAFLELL